MDKLIKSGKDFAKAEKIRSTDYAAQAEAALEVGAMQVEVPGAEVLTGFDWVLLGRSNRRLAADHRYRA